MRSIAGGARLCVYFHDYAASWRFTKAQMVVMAETDINQFHRGQGTGDCNLNQGPGGSVTHLGCAIFSENPTGGGLTVPGRFDIRFPAGAFASNLTLTYTPIFSSTHPLPDRALLDIFDLSASANGHGVTQFDEPYTMVISYNSDLVQQLGIYERTLNIVYWNGSAWVPMLPCAGCGVDTVNHRITLVANHFTEFALIGESTKRVYLPNTRR